MIRIPLRLLRITGLAVLLLPELFFLLTWVRPVFSLPSCLALAVAFILYAKKDHKKTHLSEDCSEFSFYTLAACLCCALLWTFFSGIGGFFYQNEDFYGRNAIFHDLLNYAWPVCFPETNYALTYYIGFWILPALLGKLTAFLFGAELLWASANAFLFAETVWFLFLVFLLFLSLLKIRTAGKACLMLLLFVMFSGMDGLGAYLVHWDWNQQIEWWAQLWQFSSNTTCLFWVFNQAVPAWLATLVLMSDLTDLGSYALIGLSMLLYSPLPLTGFVFLCFCLFLVRLVREKKLMKTVREAFSVRNLLSLLGALPILLYLASNASSSRRGFRFDLYLRTFSLSQALLRLLIFSFVEWLLYWLLVLPRFRKEPLFWIVGLSLFLAPMFKVGYNMDFSMRASIPGLMILFIYCARFVEDALGQHRLRPTSAVLLALLLVGFQTPLQEFERGTYRVMKAGTNRIFSDPFGTVLHPDADTHNFICLNTEQSFFYRHIASGSPTETGR